MNETPQKTRCRITCTARGLGVHKVVNGSQSHRFRIEITLCEIVAARTWLTRLKMMYESS